jgi:hypothetical protein
LHLVSRFAARELRLLAEPGLTPPAAEAFFRRVVAYALFHEFGRRPRSERDQ